MKLIDGVRHYQADGKVLGEERIECLGCVERRHTADDCDGCGGPGYFFCEYTQRDVDALAQALRASGKLTEDAVSAAVGATYGPNASLSAP